jgi:ribosome maturation factor RimP
LFDEKYRLEVSSAGVDYPLKSPRQYSKNIGRDLSMTFLDGEDMKGKLVEVKEESFVVHELVEQPKMAAKYIEKDVEITFSSINKTKVLISFN